MERIKLRREVQGRRPSFLMGGREVGREKKERRKDRGERKQQEIEQIHREFFSVAIGCDILREARFGKNKKK